MRTFQRLLLFLIATAPLAGQQPQLLVAKTIIQFGGPAENLANEMSRVSDVLRKPDGRFIVANGKPVQARLYDSNGKFVRVLGHEGGGPGEYEYGVYLKPWSGDSVLLYSRGKPRWMLYGLDGKMAREWSLGEDERMPSRAMVLRHSAIIKSGIIGSAGCPLALIDNVFPRDDGASLSFAMTDGSGRLWARDVSTGLWTVYSSSGVAIAQLKLPGEFRVTQFDGDVVVGVWADDDGFPMVSALRTGLPRAAASNEPSCEKLPLTVDRVRAAMIKTAMRNAMTFSEAFFADYKKYPAKAGDYPRGVKPDGTDFVVKESSVRGYVISISDRTTGYRCIVSVGSSMEGLLPDGMLLCGE